MIGLITGLPGNGKTLWALNFIKAKAEKENRPVYYSGIPDLNLPWTEIEGEKWMDCPPNSIIVIDECQRIYRPRSYGSNVPPHVAQLETHRHNGVDIFLITQHPMLVDTNVRRLVGLHFHVVRKFGLAASTVHEWNSCKENCDKNRDESTRHDFKYPKESFSWYKSAEVHTHKARIPMRVWLLLVVPFVLAAIVWFIWSRFQDKVSDVETPPPGVPASGPVHQLGPAPASPGSRSRPLTAAEYVQQHQPRIAGLPHTAPVYDERTRPVHVPYPAACIQSATRCQCYTQQGTRLDVSSDLCKGIAEGGFFLAWDTSGNRVDRSDQSRPFKVAAGDTSPQTASLP